MIEFTNLKGKPVKVDELCVVRVYSGQPAFKGSVIKEIGDAGRKTIDVLENVVQVRKKINDAMDERQMEFNLKNEKKHNHGPTV